METTEIEAKSYLAAIITYSDDAIIGKDLNGNITSWNPAAERIFGFTAQEAVGKHISLIIPPERLSDEDRIHKSIRQGKRIDHFETVLRAKDGRLVDLSVAISPIKSASGKVIGASRVARDISAFRQAERANAYLGAIVESSDDAIVSKDLKGFITSWNKSAERIFGYTAAEIVGRHITIIIPVERLDEEDKILSTLRNGERVDHFETLRRHKDGHLIPVSLTVSPIRNATGVVVGASKVARDISDRIQAEEALVESNRKKDDFLANMSHELRSPMNAIIGLAHLLKRLDGMPGKGIKFVDTLKTSAENMMDLINDLLDYAKIESGSIEIEKIEFNLAEQVEKTISVTNVKASEKNLTLYVNYAASLNRYHIGDPLRIHQILMNLLSNAVKFTENGSIELEISGTPTSDSTTTLVIMKVSDTGIGISVDKLSTIFEKFTQADSSITRRYGGSGLGLSITKSLVEQMGGSINVDSEPRVGTTFTITVPLGVSKRASVIESFSANAMPSLPITSRNILLVEDYEPNVMVAGEILSDMGYNFDTAYNGYEAITKFVRGRYDVILMDVQMYELDGLEATRRIRAIEAEKALPRTPIIAMTAHVREQDKFKCIEAGMDDFIPKPFDITELTQKLDRYMRGVEVRKLEAL